MTPWHLLSEAERDRVLNAIDYAGRYNEDGPAYRAAAEALRDAAPWPDEALVVDYLGMVCEILDVPMRAWWIDVRNLAGHLLAVQLSRCTPLTPAAAEFLAAVKEEMRAAQGFTDWEWEQSRMMLCSGSCGFATFDKDAHVVLERAEVEHMRAVIEAARVLLGTLKADETGLYKAVDVLNGPLAALDAAKEDK